MPCELKSGMVGISLRCKRSFQTTFCTLVRSRLWVCVQVLKNSTLSCSLSLTLSLYLFCLGLFCFMSLFLCSFFSPGVRANILKVDLSDVLPPELEDELKEAAQISMGTEVGGSGGERIIYRFTHSFTLSLSLSLCVRSVYRSAKMIWTTSRLFATR
jgi:hypothetical protein